MGKIIYLKSRYSNHKLVELLPLNGESSSPTYSLMLDENSPIRVGYTNEGKQWIDPPGGPMIIVGEMLGDMKVKAIDYSYDLNRHVITFE